MKIVSWLYSLDVRCIKTTGVFFLPVISFFGDKLHRICKSVWSNFENNYITTGFMLCVITAVIE